MKSDDDTFGSASAWRAQDVPSLFERFAHESSFHDFAFFPCGDAHLQPSSPSDSSHWSGVSRGLISPVQAILLVLFPSSSVVLLDLHLPLSFLDVPLLVSKHSSLL